MAGSMWRHLNARLERLRQGASVIGLFHGGFSPGERASPSGFVGASARGARTDLPRTRTRRVRGRRRPHGRRRLGTAVGGFGRSSQRREEEVDRKGTSPVPRFKPPVARSAIFAGPSRARRGTMGGARGDAARRVMAGSATTSNEKFADYIKFDDLFGASSIFTTGTARQRQRERELYVKDVMERKLYGYVHRLETHGEPIERVRVGGGCEAPENAFAFAAEAPRANEACARASAPELADVRAKKKARFVSAVGLGHARGGAATSPRPSAPWLGRGSSSDFSAGRFPTAHDGSLANLFEHASGEDWEQDPLWAAMEQAVAGGVGGTLEDPSNLLPSALKPSAPPAPPVDFDGEFLPRARFELIEVRHTLPPPSIPRARAIQPRRDRHPALARSDQHKKATRHRTAGTFPPRTTGVAPVLFPLPRAPFPASDAPFPPQPPARPAGAHPRVGTGAGGDEGCSARLSDDARREPPRVPGRVSSRRRDARQPRRRGSPRASRPRPARPVRPNHPQRPRSAARWIRVRSRVRREEPAESLAETVVASRSLAIAIALGRSRRGRRRGLGPRRRRDRHRHRGRSMGNHRRDPCVLFQSIHVVHVHAGSEDAPGRGRGRVGRARARGARHAQVRTRTR